MKIQRTEDNEAEYIDAAEAVDEYRRLIAQRDGQTAEIDRAEYDRMARKLRELWKAYNGDDAY